MIVLVDTGPLVALCDRRDRLHDRALRELDRLARHRFVASDAVIAEAHHLLTTRPTRDRLSALVARLPIVAATPEEPDTRRREALDWMTRYADHMPDYADALLVLDSAVTGSRVWTFDAEFRTTWRRVDGSRVPLAIG